MNIDLPLRRALEQIALAFLHIPGLERFDHSVGQAQPSIRYRPIQIDSDCSPKAAASRTRAQRIVKREKPCGRRPNIEVAIRTMPPGRKLVLLWDRLAHGASLGLVFCSPTQLNDRGCDPVLRAPRFGEASSAAIQLDDAHPAFPVL